jgi:hypothetical protein
MPCLPGVKHRQLLCPASSLAVLIVRSGLGLSISSVAGTRTRDVFPTSLANRSLPISTAKQGRILNAAAERDYAPAPFEMTGCLLSREAIDDNAVGFAEIGNHGRVKPAGEIRLPEFRDIEEVKDEADMARIAGVVESLYLSHCRA